MNKSPYLSYGKQWVDEKDIRSIIRILKSDWLTQGPSIELFETQLAKKIGTKYAVAVATGTAALHAACYAIGITTGDEVIVPTLTFAASANCVVYCGGTPVLCDIDQNSLCIDTNKLEEKINSRTKAIIAVDFAGHPADWNKLKTIAKKHKIILIADAAHSLGATYKNKSVGTLADLTVFSFHPVKAITTAEGGMVVTNNKNYAEKMKLFRNHGIAKPSNLQPTTCNLPTWYQEMIDLGYNYRITDIQAALGLSQLTKLDRFIAKRRIIASQYSQAFQNESELILPPNSPEINHAWHLFVLQFRSRNRDQIYNQLKEAGIGTQVHYMPIHLQPYYEKRFGYKNGDFPIAEKYFSRCLSIPIYPKMKFGDVKRVITAIKSLSS